MNWDMHWLSTAFDGFLGFLPNLVAGLIILLIGYLVAKVLGRVTSTVLHRAGFDRFMTRLGFVNRGESDVASVWTGKAVFAVIILGTIMQVARTWNLTFVAVGFARIIAYLPHVLGAVVIFGAAMFLGNWVRDRLLRSPIMNGDRVAAGDQMRLVPSVVRGAIITIGAFMALRELQIAPEIVSTAFTLTLGTIAVAAALAFGLGGRDVAGRIAQSWYERRRSSVTSTDYFPSSGGPSPRGA
ncbi:Small-conductance mechanosensitive channel [Labilithrix luteola]|uniref:Small-conductance mechanosensitive channel n=1 Tax=Labilithrix luteola TaxID=1391654 RepID=A0A0K1Q0X1_9BACT|nr:hypothetical protein [Labilithrix luteola]AKU99382.1 Small-conductance mechanosensitive channel [Labilithrix luteola]